MGVCGRVGVCMIYVLKVPEVFPCTTTMCCELDNAKAKKGGAGKRTGGNATIKNAALRRWEDTHWIAHNAHTHTRACKSLYVFANMITVVPFVQVHLGLARI